jgi:HlyD family secretion protein
MYTLTTFNSGTQSGYSYRLSGLETGTFTAYTETPAPIGTCGLSIQFIDGETYSNSVWTITIPNAESSSYITNRNAYTLAQTERENAIRTAEQNLTLAKQTEALNIADPRSESSARAQAKILQAEARLKRIEAEIQDHILTAPFDGVVSHTNLIAGETVGTEPVLTIISQEAFELTALVPEIDITKIKTGHKAFIVFDARPDEKLSASISFISPLAREIDGVSYFETKLVLDDSTDWIQSGLNADIDIVIEKHDDVLRIPKRFLIHDNNTYSVLLPDGKNTKSLPVTVTFEGNDGFVQVEGLNIGDVIVAP